MDRQREKLIALVLGDLQPDEIPGVEAQVSGDVTLQSQRDSLQCQVAAMRALPDDDIPQAAVDRVLEAARHFHEEPEAVQLARVITLRTFINVYLPRIAAAALFVLMVGYAVHYLPEGPQASVATVVAADGNGWAVTDGDLVEARIGSPLRIRFQTGELLLDGGAAVRVSAQGPYKAPQFEVDRGRVVVDAARAPVQLSAAGRSLELEPGAVVALDLDREHARIMDGGAVVEIQRTAIEDVVRAANEAYGMHIDDSLLPDAVKRRRVTFFGTQLGKREFADSFVQAASVYGVRLSGNRLLYEAGTTHRVDDTEFDTLLSVSLLNGAAEISQGNTRQTMPASIAFTRDGALPGAERPEHTFVWARGMGNAVVDAKLRNVSTGDATLPAGSVIHPDRLVLPEGSERIFVLHGPDFNFPLPGGRKGRLVGLLSSGAEFELEGGVTRVFVPHSSVASR